MGLPEKYDSRLRSNTGLRAVWLPGSPIDLGDVLQRKDGIFSPVANLSDFGVTFRNEKLPKDRTLNFQAQGVSTTVIQAGASVDLSQVDVNAKADLNIDFSKDEGYFLRTPRISGVGIDDLFKVGKRIVSVPDWNHGKFYLVWRVLSADDFVFIGSEKKGKKIGFSALGKAIINFLTLGLTAGVTLTSSSSGIIEVVGKGGPVAINVAKIKKNGEVDFH